MTYLLLYIVFSRYKLAFFTKTLHVNNNCEFTLQLGFWNFFPTSVFLHYLVRTTVFFFQRPIRLSQNPEPLSLLQNRYNPLYSTVMSKCLSHHVATPLYDCYTLLLCEHMKL